MTASEGVGRWTRRFAVGSALSMVALQFALLLGASFRVAAVVGLFGAVLPMVFGMAYLLFPSYVGRTLSTRRLPGVHLVAAYLGVGLLLAHELLGGGRALLVGGVTSWSVGVAVFVGAILRTVLPEVPSDPGSILRPGAPSGRSTGLATLAIPVAVCYLAVGTVALVSTAIGHSGPLDSSLGPLDASVPTVVHLHAAGVVALLVFALGIRLLTGFFHVTPPRSASWLTLVCGGVAPAVLAVRFYRPPWFLVGAGLELLAVLGYAAVVAVVAYRTERRRVGLYGIVLGAIGGVVAVGVALATVLGIGGIGGAGIAVHVVVTLDGFLLPTIVGYAYQFFPVTNGEFPGATERTAYATILALGAGTGTYAVGGLGGVHGMRTVGICLALIGTVGYSYLLCRRFHRRGGGGG